MTLNKRNGILSAVLISSLLLSGCGLLGTEEVKKIDPPPKVTYEDPGKGASEETVAKKEKTNDKKAKENTVMTELYLIDKDGYVVPQTIALPKEQGIAKEAMEYLVSNGPIADLLPNGFKAVLPPDTQSSVNIQDGVATVDFSKEFKNYKKEDELRILQAVTWTMTQFDSVKTVKLRMNGKDLTEMPVHKTPIAEKLNREIGINIDAKDVVDLANTKAITVYYLGGEEGSSYYVPVTKRVDKEVTNNIEAVVNELVVGPNYTSNLNSDFASSVKLLDKPVIENGKVTLNFNEAIYGSFKEKMVSEHLLNALVLSLTEQEGIESVAILVKGKSEIINEKGKKLSEPVTRPEKLNTGSF